jgi:hypothetical protein
VGTPVITIGCTEEDEARDLADILRLQLPAEWDYEIFCRGEKFISKQEEEDSGRRRRKMALDLLAEAGPAGITVYELRVRLRRAGFRTAPATLYRWLNESCEAGLVTHSGTHWMLARQES